MTALFDQACIVGVTVTALPAGGTVRVSLSRAGDAVQLAVSDDGVVVVPRASAESVLRQSEAREAKAQTIRYLNIETGYSDEKKLALWLFERFGLSLAAALINGTATHGEDFDDEVGMQVDAFYTTLGGRVTATPIAVTSMTRPGRMKRR